MGKRVISERNRKDYATHPASGIPKMLELSMKKTVTRLDNRQAARRNTTGASTASQASLFIFESTSPDN
jgi:hypothetical protein